jgi:hypothetical protein
MFSKIERGSEMDVQGLMCHIPEPGWVFNVVSKKLEHRGIFKRSAISADQHWERTPLPGWYKKTIKLEEEYERKQKPDDPPFYDENLERYKKTEWDRRLNGHWFMNNGLPVYLTGSHYMYLQWFQMDIGYPKFRIPDLEYFYFQQYCIEDPECMGMLEITKRRFGKTFRGGLFLLDYNTRARMTNGGIQSKTGKDAKKVFAKAVISPFKKFPRFFRPEYDMSLGITPKTEIRFQQTNIRGQKAEEGLDKEELGSMIDWESADTIAYDGQKIHRYFGDEWCKTTEVNVYDRHEVIRYCLMDDEGKIIGKALYSSTVEKLDTDRDGIQDAAKILWDDSDQNHRQENGRTASGLYRFFMTADRAKNFDIYGTPDVEKTIKEILEDRESVKHNLRSLTKRIKKEARTIEEAFSSDSDKCIFNTINIAKRKSELNGGSIAKRSVIFYRDLDQVIKWRDVNPKNSYFYWSITAFPPLGQENKSITVSNLKKPGRTDDGAIAIDGYSNSQGGQKYGSKASAWIGRKFDILDPANTGKAIGHLYGRPAVKETLHEQVMMAAEYYGYTAWYEHNSDDYLSYFRERGKIGYLGTYPLSTIDPIKRSEADRYKGFPTTPFSLTRQVDTGIAYVENYCHLIDYIELLEDMERFDPNNRNEFDITVSFLMLLVCLMEPVYKPAPRKTPLVTVYENENYGKDVIEL